MSSKETACFSIFEQFFWIIGILTLFRFTIEGVVWNTSTDRSLKSTNLINSFYWFTDWINLALWLLLGTLKFATCTFYILPFSPSTTCMTSKGFVCSPVHREVNIHWKIQWNGSLLKVSLYFPKIKEAEFLAGCSSIWCCHFVYVFSWDSTAAIISSIVCTIAASHNVTGLFTLLKECFILFILTMNAFSSQWNPTFLL